MANPRAFLISKLFRNLIWSLLSWGLFIVIVCAVMIGLFLYHRVDEEIRTQVEMLLAEQYPDQKVSVRSARLIELQGFEIRGVSLTPRSSQPGSPPLAIADEVLVRCKPRVEELLKGQLEIEEIVARRVTIRCSRQSDGSWTIQQLIKMPRLCGASQPTLRLENSTLEIVDTYSRPQRLYTVRDVNVCVAPGPVPSSSGQAGQGPAQLRVYASASGDHLQRFSIDGTLVPETGQFHLASEKVLIDFSPALRDALPVEWAKHIGNLGSLVAKTELSFEVTQDPGRPSPLTYRVIGKLRNGRLEDPRLPYPLTDVTAGFHCDEQRSVVDEIRARYGGATIDLSIDQQGAGTRETMVVKGQIENFTLREDLISRLSPEVQDTWQRFRPLGNGDVAFSFSLQDGRWTPNVDVTCHDVSLRWEAFPYPLLGTKGTISLRGDQVDFDLRSLRTPQPIHLSGHVSDPGAHWSGWFEAHSEGPIPLDETLLAAGSETMQRVVRPFAARGEISFKTRTERRHHQLPTTRRAVVQLVDCSVQHAHFQYPIHGVTGRLEMVDDQWKFLDLAGRNDTARIRGEGRWSVTPEGGVLQMAFEARDVPLENELRNALPPTAQQTWSNLRPRGTLDHLAARYQFTPASGTSSIAVDLKQWKSQSQDLEQSLSVMPVSFPYRIDDVTGSILYRNGQLTLSGMRGHHGAVTLSTNGRAGMNAQGGWQLELHDFHVDRLQLDADLLAAAPPRLRRGISQAGFRGATSLDGTVALFSTEPDGPTHSRWNLSVDLEDASIGNQCSIEHIVGLARLAGEATDKTMVCVGNLAIDSMMFQGVHLANVTSPIWSDGNRVLLGRWAQPADVAYPSSLSAQMFGGKLQADAQIMMDVEGSFETSLRLRDANLATVARDLRLPAARVTGLASANVLLRGTGQGRETWRGKGDVVLADTDLYELPMVLTLLKTLRTGSTDRTAFDQVAVDFRIQGEHTYLDRMDLHGDALTLKGVGEMNRQKDVNLNFYTIVGREKAYVEAVRPLLGMASRKFMVVKVRGPLNQPNMTREVLPDLNATLQEWFAESDASSVSRGVEQVSHERLGSPRISRP